MSHRFQLSLSLFGLLGSLIACSCLLLTIAGCDSTETAVSDHPPGSDSEQQSQRANTDASIVSDATTKLQAPLGNKEDVTFGDSDSQQQNNRETALAQTPSGERKVAPLPIQFQGPAEKAKQLKVDSERLVANGIRTVTGKQLILHTDLPLDDELRSLPNLFEEAVKQFCTYFEVDITKVAQWQVRACIIQNMEKFENAGLLPQVLPKFQHGYSLGDRVFLKEQPSEYYRRHLLIHEGVHSFMLHFFQGAGPPWYMEGMAELLATHQWDGEQLKLRNFPADKTEVPFWGRVKIIKADVAAQKGKLIEQVMQYGSNAHLNVEAYGWSWAATTFLDQHPEFQKIFRKHAEKAGDSSPQFSLDLIHGYGEQWSKVRQQWQLFVMNMEYGYDIKREAIDDVRVQQYAQLPAQQSIQVKADRGWQSTGLAVTKGMKIQLKASGRFVIHQESDAFGKEFTDWESEANGITIQYYKGNPLGKLLIAIDNLNQTGVTGLVSYAAIGAGGEIEIPDDGVLYLRVNDSPSELHDNRGELDVKIMLMAQN
ncbi:MAG: hypothetical protein CMJ76_04905 [Planctomycetaceae bacterium]|nr:hypothetical protein [Planctomycetaceae bacterium]|tara:strand:- start:2794 stop:4410 length:1617 start_codon:yes stop_codon:yes gene_type:complete